MKTYSFLFAVALFIVGTVLVICSDNAFSARASSPKALKVPVEQHHASKSNADTSDHWMRNFYLYPTASKTTEMINQMITSKYFSQLKPYQAQGIIVFFSCLFRRYPGSIVDWVEGVKFDNQRSRMMIYQAVWDSDTAEGRNYLLKVQKKSKPVMAKKIQKLFAIAPRNIAKTKISFDTLEQFWAAYFATGDVQYLKPIVMVAVTHPAKINAKKLVDAASSSVIANGKSHFDLPSVYLAIASELPSEQKQAVIDIVYKNISQN